jgi:hypothetical protein
MMGLSKKENREKIKHKVMADTSLGKQPGDEVMRGEGCMCPDGSERIEHLSIDEDYSDEVPLEYVPEHPNVEDVITRFVWKPESRNEGAKQKVPSEYIWDSIPMLTQDAQNHADGGICSLYRRLTDPHRFGCATCSWDDQFGPKEEIGEEGLDGLLGLFQGEAEVWDEDTINKHDGRSSVHEEPTSLSMLSPVANRIATEIIADISDSKDRVMAIERSCPSWKENVTFALRQKDPDAIQNALQSLKESRERMQLMKQRILQTWERQSMTLDVFEAALEASAARLTPRGPQLVGNEVIDGGFLTQVHENDNSSANVSEVAQFAVDPVELHVASQ